MHNESCNSFNKGILKPQDGNQTCVCHMTIILAAEDTNLFYGMVAPIFQEGSQWPSNHAEDCRCGYCDPHAFNQLLEGANVVYMISCS